MGRCAQVSLRSRTSPRLGQRGDGKGDEPMKTLRRVLPGLYRKESILALATLVTLAMLFAGQPALATSHGGGGGGGGAGRGGGGPARGGGGGAGRRGRGAAPGGGAGPHEARRTPVPAR